MFTKDFKLQALMNVYKVAGSTQNNTIYKEHNGAWKELTPTELSAVQAEEAKLILQDVKDTKYQEIKDAMNGVLDKGYLCTNGITMDAHFKDIQALKAGYDLALALGSTTMDITDHSNTTHAGIKLTAVDAMLKELGVNFNTLRVKKNTLRDSIVACTDEVCVGKIVW